MTTATTTTTNDAPYSELELHAVHHDGRDITFSTSPDNGSPPVLFFYPVGAGRRMLLSFRSLYSCLRFICVNRPGKGGTSASIPKESTHLDTVVQDVITVLDHLKLDRVSVLAMCAGTPFAMVFCSRHPERTTRNFMGISSWIQPADCGYSNTKLLYHIGTQLPSCTGPLAGTLMSTTGRLFSSFPTSWFVGFLRKKLSPQERNVFEKQYPDISEFCDMLQWMQQDARGGVNEDIVVLLSANAVDYDAFANSQTSSIVLWHGTSDSMVPCSGAEWLSDQVPKAALRTIPNGTHEGCMFLLHSKIVESLERTFGRD